MPRDLSWRDPATLVQIYYSAGLIDKRMRGVSLETFLDDIEKQDLAVLRITLIGEATKRLSAEYRAAHAHIPWAAMAGMRDNLVHGYDQWDLKRVWEVATLDIPKLLQDLGPLVPRPDGA
jgi:uncharacterized protein with HEPN domain